jgi:hypothetical protein
LKEKFQDLKKIGAERIDTMSQYNVIITRSESTMIRVEAKDQDEALDKAEEEVFDNPDDMDWGSNDDYDFHIALVEE